MKLLFLIFTGIAKLNTHKMFYNHQIAKSNTSEVNAFEVSQEERHKIIDNLDVNITV